MATQKQINIYRELNDIKLKAIITLVVLGCFVVGFGFVIFLICSNHPWQNTALVGTLDGLIALSFPHILKHHFPNRTT